jgi:ADP-ribose pyrophosphatase
VTAPSGGPVADRFDARPVRRRLERFDGLRWSIRTDIVQLPDGDVLRDYVVHPGAVGIVVLDDAERVLLVQQYRHAVGSLLWEAPAGLMDISGEQPLRTAQRELLEEAGVTAATWHVLADWCNSPGGSTETFRCYLARDITAAPEGRQGEAEEADMPAAWVPLDEAVDLVFAGALTNPTAVGGILATWAARGRGWHGLRPADAPWPLRDELLRSERVWSPPEQPRA